MSDLKTALLAASAMAEQKAAPAPERDILVQFAAEISVVRASIVALKSGGLAAVCNAGTLAWQLVNMHGMTAAQVSVAITGTAKNVTDKTAKRVLRNARRLALKWQTDGLPDGLRGANSFEGACSAALAWLGGHSITSQEAFEAWIGGNATKAKAPLGERVAKIIEGAYKADTMTAGDARKIMVALCALSFRGDYLGDLSKIVSKVTGEHAKVKAKVKAKAPEPVKQAA